LQTSVNTCRDRSKIHCLNLYEQTPNRHSSGAELAAVNYPAYFQALQTERTIAADDAYNDPRTYEFGTAYLPAVGVTQQSPPHPSLLLLVISLRSSRLSG